MKKILIATALLAGFTFAATPKPDTTKFVAPKFDTAKVDSFLTAHKAKVDSLFAEFKKHVPDSLKLKVDTAEKAWKLADTSKGPGKVDSLRKFNTGKRDSLIAKIKDTAIAGKIKARIADLEADKSALKAKLDARKAVIDAKLADIKKNKK